MTFKTPYLYIGDMPPEFKRLILLNNDPKLLMPWARGIIYNENNSIILTGYSVHIRLYIERVFEVNHACR